LAIYENFLNFFPCESMKKGLFGSVFTCVKMGAGTVFEEFKPFAGCRPNFAGGVFKIGFGSRKTGGVFVGGGVQNRVWGCF
jgi:hypothetical protein